MLTLSLNDMNLRVKECIRTGSETHVDVTNNTNELWIIYGIQDFDGATNTYTMTYVPKGGAVTWTPFRQTAASAVPVGVSTFPPVRRGDTLIINGTVATNYLLMYQAVPLPKN